MSNVGSNGNSAQETQSPRADRLCCALRLKSRLFYRMLLRHCTVVQLPAAAMSKVSLIGIKELSLYRDSQHMSIVNAAATFYRLLYVNIDKLGTYL